MSGGYEDDIDQGDFMYVTDLCCLVRFISPSYRKYTGTGGYGDDKQYGGGNSRAWGSNIQTDHQTFSHRDNNALLVRGCSPAENSYLTTLQVSKKLGKPVRVIRGHALRSKYAPLSGFVVGNTTNGMLTYIPY
jgi:hypothetical protein